MRRKNALYNILSNTCLQIIIIFCGFIIPKVIINNFGSEVNGLIASISMFLGYISFIEAGFGPVIKSSLYSAIANKNNDEILNILKVSDSIFKKISKIFIIYIVFLAILYPLLLCNEFNYIYTVSMIFIIAISVFSEYYFGITYGLFLQANQKSYVISTVQIITYILNVCIILLLVNFNASIHIIKLISSLIFILRPLFLNFYVKHKYNININSSNGNYVLKQKWDGLAQHIASVIHNNTDIVVLTIFTTLTTVSIYATYYLVIKALKAFINAITSGIDSTFGNILACKEKENLNFKFCLFETIYFTLVTIIYLSSLFLINKFIFVYTNTITDIVYVNNFFGCFMVIGEFFWAIRQPYNIIIKSAGKFKETRIGAWIEAGLNLVISLLLVKKYGLVGVAIGTLVAMFIRTLEFMYYSSKHILDRTSWYTYKRLFIIAGEIVIIVLISKFLPVFVINNYYDWIIYAIIIVVISTLVVVPINALFYKQEFKDTINLIKSIFKRKKVNK